MYLGWEFSFHALRATENYYDYIFFQLFIHLIWCWSRQCALAEKVVFSWAIFSISSKIIRFMISWISLPIHAYSIHFRSSGYSIYVERLKWTLTGKTHPNWPLMVDLLDKICLIADIAQLCKLAYHKWVFGQRVDLTNLIKNKILT